MAQLLPPLRPRQAAASSSLRDSCLTPPAIRSSSQPSDPRQLKLPSLRTLDLLPLGAQARVRELDGQSRSSSIAMASDSHDSLLGSPEEVKPKNLAVPVAVAGDYGSDLRAPHNMRRSYGVSRHLSVSSSASDAMSIDHVSPEGDEGYDSAVSHGSGMAFSSASASAYPESSYTARLLTPPNEPLKASNGKLSSILNHDIPDSLAILSDVAGTADRDARYELERRRAGTMPSAFHALKGSGSYRYRDYHPDQAHERYRQQPSQHDSYSHARLRSLSDQDARLYAARGHPQQHRPISPPRSYTHRHPSKGSISGMPSVLQKPYSRAQPYPPSHRPNQQRPPHPPSQAIYQRPDQVIKLKSFPDFDRSFIYRASVPQGSNARPAPPNPPKLQLPNLSNQKRASQESLMSGAGDRVLQQPKQPNTIALPSIDDANMPTVDRPFSCPGCDRTFTRRYDRNRHARKHTGEKPYPCGNPDCSEGFGRPDALQRHYRSHPECEAFKDRSRRTSVSSSTGSEPRVSLDQDRMMMD